MATNPDVFQHVQTLLEGIEGIRFQRMMGEYVIYYHEKVVAFIADDHIMVKETSRSRQLLPDASDAFLFPGAKPMLCIDDWIFDNHPSHSQRLIQIFQAMWDELPFPKPRNKAKKQDTSSS